MEINQIVQLKNPNSYIVMHGYKHRSVAKDGQEYGIWMTESDLWGQFKVLAFHTDGRVLCEVHPAGITTYLISQRHLELGAVAIESEA